MTRALVGVDAADPVAVGDALLTALTADGPAVFPVPAGREPPTDLPGAVPQRIALVVETSGSSGRPKRVALTADAVLASAAASETALGGGGRWLLALPAHYIAGVNVLARSITAQTTPVVLGAGGFRAEEFVAAARTLDADRRYTSVVPVQLARLMALADTDAAALDTLRRFDRVLVGGQALPEGLVERAGALGIRVTRTYGASETCGGCVYDGRPLATVSARVVDGEIELGGPTLAEQYLDDAERTSAAFVSGDGTRWYRTGDTGAIVDGVLTVTGRRDRVIVSGGEKISLDAVEEVLRGLPGHADAVAVAVDDAEWGQSVGLVLTTEATAALSDALMAALGRAARPRRTLTVEAVPRLLSGKPDRVACAALLTAG